MTGAAASSSASPGASFGPPPAELLDEQGSLRVGTYVGAPRLVDLGGLAARGGRLFTLTRRKRWMYAAIATGEVYIGAAIVDLGYAANAFAFAADVRPGARGMLADVSFLGVPGVGCRVGDRPEEGCDAWFRAPGARFSLSRPRGQGAYDLEIVTRRLTVHARMDTEGAPPPVCAVALPDGSAGNFTEKRALLGVTGVADVGGERLLLDGGLGGFDYTHGFPPRETRWKWAYLLGRSTDGRRVGMNLVEGFNGSVECAVWVEGEALPVGEGRFRFDPTRPMVPWGITTTCGVVDLEFVPAALHAERRNLGLVRSSFIQPAGVYRGVIRPPGRPELRLEAAPGVAEDQHVLW